MVYVYTTASVKAESTEVVVTKEQKLVMEEGEEEEESE